MPSLDESLSAHPQWQQVIALARVVRANPARFDAVNAAVQALGQLAQDVGISKMLEISAPVISAAPSVSVVICSINETRFERVVSRYRELIPADKIQIIGIHDARTLHEGYNRGLAQVAGEHVIFSHDDIDIASPHFYPRLAAYLGAFDVIGVVGATLARGPGFGWAGHPYLHGWVAHPGPAGGWMAGCYGLNGGPVPGAQMFDGLWFACRTNAARSIRFDERLAGFHFYDADFSYRAYLAGLKTAIVPGLGLMHDSHGSFDESWQRASRPFLQKFPHLNTKPAGPVHAYGTALPDREAVNRFYELLDLLGRTA